MMLSRARHRSGLSPIQSSKELGPPRTSLPLPSLPLHARAAKLREPERPAPPGPAHFRMRGSSGCQIQLRLPEPLTGGVMLRMSYTRALQTGCSELTTACMRLLAGRMYISVRVGLGVEERTYLERVADRGPVPLRRQSSR